MAGGQDGVAFSTCIYFAMLGCMTKVYLKKVIKRYLKVSKSISRSSKGISRRSAKGIYQDDMSLLRAFGGQDPSAQDHAPPWCQVDCVSGNHRSAQVP